ncbi:MAG TPA: ATP-binding protein [Solirubrobacteraceae bacterium]|nr:ATP-binding protein [Solirubrobacteraceae bacterium]
MADRAAVWLGRRSLRLRLTLAFAGAAAVLLGSLALALYVSFESGLDGGIDRSLHASVAALTSFARQAEPDLAHLRLAGAGGSGSAAQILDSRGGVLDSAPGLGHAALLTQSQLSAALHAPVHAGGRALLASRLKGSDGDVLVVGVLLGQRNHALTVLGDLLFIGGPIMLLLACAAAYWLAARALAPVERMRRRAAEISGGERDARLPVPDSSDVLSRLGETLNEMLGRIAEAVARERALVSHASHELRTPLAVLKLELELALGPERSREEMASALASAVEEVDRLTRLASDLLVIASAEQGQLPVRLRELDVAQAVRTIAERFDRIAQTQGRSVSAGCGEALIARVDPDRLGQAVDNLVANALRHGAGAVEIETRASSAQVEIHVFDDGGGFPEDFLPHAFEPFTRADPARSGEATGLGLSIVLAIAAAHGGSAGAENRPSGGAHVWVALPREALDVAGSLAVKYTAARS